MTTAWQRLCAGDWARENFDAWLRPLARKAIVGAPQWRGESAAKVFVLHECGHGDSLMLVRYAKAMADRGCTVYWQSTPPLAGLIDTAPGVALAMSKLDELTRIEVTAWARSLDLPGMFGATPSAPGGAVAPYLTPSWRKLTSKLGRTFRFGKIQLGICWHGGYDLGYGPERDLPLELVLQLIIDARADWVSLCPGESLPAAPAAIPDGAPFLRTAEAMCALDGIVTTDTAVAHLAGAIGVPTMLLLQHEPDWRWARDAQWYPSVCQFRQRTPGDWDSVVREVTDAINGAN